ncbi:MAG: HypC/HybG/HupF family hydrogenase formation chaperone [Oligoflexia bacterium]|nr:HypC/HybG/HupF family hydrogenase formation chaperone [Oligoflexia bacterium]
MCLAVPVKVTEVKENHLAVVEMNNVKLNVSRLLVDNLQIGDYVLIHAGFIIEKMSYEEAKDKLDLFDEYYRLINSENSENSEQK